MKKIVGIGACVMDTLIMLEHYPKEDIKLRAEYSRSAGGGPAATGLVAAAKLGIRAEFIGSLSDDNGGNFLKGDFEKYGVGTDNIITKHGYRSFTSVIWLSAESGSRTCVFDKGDIPELKLNEKQTNAIKNADLLLLDGNEMHAALEAVKIAKESGTKVLIDAGGLYEGMGELIKYADILIPSEEFALGITEAYSIEKAAEILYKNCNPQVVIITEGEKGGIFYDGKNTVRYPSFKVEVKDSNGAGDVFHGAFAAGVLKGYNYYDCCIFASAVSAVKCIGVGSRQSIPDFDTVNNFLKENGYEFEKTLG